MGGGQGGQAWVPLPNRPFLRYFVPLALLVVVATTTGGALAAQSRADDAREGLRGQQLELIGGLDDMVLGEVIHSAADVLVLARQDAFLDLSATPTDAELDRLASLFVGLAEIRGSYDQIRFLDNDGMERVRVDHRGGSPSRATDLQDKSDRYYFTDSVGLPRGAIYLSPLDLNVEHGEVEQPVRPMLRFATPVFDRTGEQRGVAMVNDRGRAALDGTLAWGGEGLQATLHVVNGDGYWLHAPDEQLEWGWMLDRPDDTLARVDPAAWSVLRDEQPAQVMTDTGLYTSLPVRPLDAVAERLPTQATSSDSLAWTVYSLVPADVIAADVAAGTRTVAGQVLLVALFGLALAAVAASALGRRWSTQQDLEQRTIELGMTAHDLRNPLGAIRGFAETLQAHASDRLRPTEMLLLERISSSSGRMLELVSELVDFSALEHGVRLDVEQVDLQALVLEVVDLIGFMALDKDITLSVDVTEEILAAGDREKLHHVVMNLATNAIKYSPRGSEVLLTLETLDSHIELRVTDHGVGIPADEQEEIFEPFNKGSSRPTEGERSTGLGLAIADRVVKAHGGTLSVESKESHGSTFTMRLPRQQSPTQEPNDD